MTEAPGGWEPGVPSLRVIAPSALGGALVPIGVYYAVRHPVGSTATALIIACIPAAAWVITQLIRTRHIDLIGAITLYGFAVGVVASVTLHGNAFVLKVREIAFEVPFAIACLLSIWLTSRPVLFRIGKSLSAGNDDERRAAYDELYELPTVPGVFARLSVVWGVVMLLHSGILILLAIALPTGGFLAVAPVVAGLVFGGLFVFTSRYSKRARVQGEAILLEQGLTYPSVPAVVGDAISG